MPEKHSWLLFKKWADEYGPIFRFTIGTQNNVVVSTEKIANELLRERGNIYSSREQQVFAADLMSHNLRPLFLPYNGTSSLPSHHSFPFFLLFPPFHISTLSFSYFHLTLDLWRRGRKLMHHLTMTQMATSYQPMQSLESKK